VAYLLALNSASGAFNSIAPSMAAYQQLKRQYRAVASYDIINGGSSRRINVMKTWLYR